MYIFYTYRNFFCPLHPGGIQLICLRSKIKYLKSKTQKLFIGYFCVINNRKMRCL